MKSLFGLLQVFYGGENRLGGLKIGETDTKERILMYRSGKGFAYCPVQEGHEFKIHGLRGATVRP